MSGTTDSHCENGNGRVVRVLWVKFIWRQWLREKGLTAMLIGILALGVAVFLAVRLANKAAVTGFGMFTESVSGESDFLIRPKAGMLPDSLLRELRDLTGSLPVGLFPVLEVSGALTTPESDGGGLLRLVGADLVALQNLAGEARLEGLGALSDKTAGYVGEAFARKYRVSDGDPFELILGDRTVTLTIAGVLKDDPNRISVPGNLILMDLPGLYELTEQPEALSRIEVRIPPGWNREEIIKDAAAIFEAFAKERNLGFETPGERKSSVTQMSAAFRLNLTILSGLALLVGFYLIMQAMEAAVVKRRSEIAVLRSLGVTPDQIRRAWLFEGLVLGLVGSVVGVVLGRLLAVGLVGGISRTVNTLYYETTSDAVALEVAEVAFAVAFGVVASVAAGFVPARDAATTSPAQAMRQGLQGGGLAVLRRWPVGIILFLIGLGFALLPAVVLPGGNRVPLGGYLAACLMVIATSILIGLFFKPAARIIAFGKGGAMRHYAASQLRRPEGRHRLTAAGLAVAIGMSAAMAILVASFEGTLTSWIGQLLKADIYVAAAGSNSVANGNSISRKTWERILTLPGVGGADKLQRYPITFEGREVFLGGADYNSDPERFLQLIWIDRPERSGPEALSRQDGMIPAAWISEPFSRRFKAVKGSVLDLPTGDGVESVEVTGVYADYGNEAGTIIVDRALTSRWYGDDSVSQLALYLEPGGSEERILDRIGREFPELVVRSNERVRTESIRIFHQTFAVTYALEAIAVIISVTGLGLALAGLLLERRNDLATLRALGTRRRGIAAASAWEGAGLAMVGLAGGFLLSFFLGWILIHVINPQSFGWTLQYRVPWGAFGALALLTLVIATSVSWGVGYRAAHLQSDREE